METEIIYDQQELAYMLNQRDNEGQFVYADLPRPPKAVVYDDQNAPEDLNADERDC